MYRMAAVNNFELFGIPAVYIVWSGTDASCTWAVMDGAEDLYTSG